MRTTMTTHIDNFRPKRAKAEALGVPVWSEDDLDAVLGGLS